MKKAICALMLCLALCMPVAAGAFETPLTDPKGVEVLKKLGTFFAPIADQYSCGDFAWGNVSNGGRLAMLEYVPAGVKVAEWTRMVTVTVYSLEGDALQQKAQMTAISDALNKQVESNGKLLNHALFKNKAGEMSSYLEYEAGLGAAKEHNAGVFMRVTPTLSAFMQIQARNGADLSADDLLKTRKLVDSRAK